MIRYWVDDIKKHQEMTTVLAAAVLCLIVRNAVGIGVILAVCIAALLAEKYLADRALRRRLKALTDYISAVQDDLSLPPIETDEEGEFGILQSEVYKVVALLRQKYSTEEKQKRYMADMLSDISHQIKTPLTAIQLMTELLEQPTLDAYKRLEYAEKIDTQVTRITWLIRNLLTLSQMEAGVLRMKRKELPLTELMAQVRGSLDIMAELKGVEILADVPDDLTVKGDPHWLAEGLTNIVKNCVEHTESGGYVKISADRNPLFTQLTIEDNGTGIAPDDLPHIFERFYKAKNSSAQSVGIGLALAKQIIGRHNGTIEAQSEEGKGSVFTVKLYRVWESD